MQSLSIVGNSIPRKEDPRLIVGNGKFVDDVKLPGMLYAAFLRSPHAHARIRSVDCTQASTLPGVESVITYSDCNIDFPSSRQVRAVKYPCLAHKKVRFIGEPIAAVAARDRATAVDALELIKVEYEPLPAVTDSVQSTSPNTTLIHEEYKDNILFHEHHLFGDVDRAFREADEIIEGEFHSQRCSGAPMECRGCVAHFDAFKKQLTFWGSSQTPHPLRTLLSSILKIPENDVRVIVADVGGAFGNKLIHPEDIAVCCLSMRTNSPVKWIEDRRENLSAGVHAREQVHKVRVAVKNDGRILGIRNTVIGDMGAYPHITGANPILTSAFNLPQAYKLPSYEVDVYCVATNKAPHGAYRGYGKPEATFVMERIIDAVSSKLGLDPFDVRIKNLIQQNDLPYTNLMKTMYDSGSFAESLLKAKSILGSEEFREQQNRLLKQGRYTGLGIIHQVCGCSSNEVYTINWPGYEVSTVLVNPGGTVTLLTGQSPHGQGLETTLAQVVAEELGLRVDDVTVMYGDTATTSYGLGTWGVRGSVVGSVSAMMAARMVGEKILKVASHLLSTNPKNLVMKNGEVTVRDSPEKKVTLGEIARLTYYSYHKVPKDMEPRLEATYWYEPPNITPHNHFAAFSNATHACTVEVDTETGLVHILKYVIVHDSGKVINPLIVEGQVHGGLAQGLGGALYEELVYNDEGQLLNPTLTDYTVPTSLEIPQLHVSRLETPSPSIPGGFKGAGEDGIIGVTACVCAAVEDALKPFGVSINRIPLKPESVLALISKKNTGTRLRTA